MSRLDLGVLCACGPARADRGLQGQREAQALISIKGDFGNAPRAYRGTTDGRWSALTAAVAKHASLRLSVVCSWWPWQNAGSLAASVMTAGWTYAPAARIREQGLRGRPGAHNRM
jgi:hypothetical protein